MPSFKSLYQALLTLSLAFSATASPLLEKRTARTSTPSGCLTVRGSGTKSGEYSTVAAALKALGSSTSAACVFIYSGTYTEQITINYAGALTLYGYTTDTGSYKNNAVTITHSINSSAAGSLDASSTVNIVSANFKAYNIIFKNTYGAGAQAVAVTANGDKQGYYGCSFTGYQDTLYTKFGKQYYSNCYIEGTIASNGGGAITASSRTLASETGWFVIDSSTITQASTATTSLTGKVYLGRPWRVLARVIFQNSVLTDIINAAGWTTLAADATP
ncbi:hypothetical protein ACMFMG_011262 [Clarireedia jacksonii]